MSKKRLLKDNECFLNHRIVTNAMSLALNKIGYKFLEHANPAFFIT